MRTKPVREIELRDDPPKAEDVDASHVAAALEEVGIDYETDSGLSIRHAGGGKWRGPKGSGRHLARSTRLGHIIVTDPETGETRRFIPDEGSA